MKFTKMQGIGNDYIYIYTDGEFENIGELSIRLSDRHFGIGSDGLIFISKSEIADFKMRIFNADGSEAKMCGNGIRCVGKYVFDHKLTNKKDLLIETVSGIKHLHLETKDGKVSFVSVKMGKSTVGKEQKISINNKSFIYYPVDMGNPHAVIFCDNATDDYVKTTGKLFQNIKDFKSGVNVEFITILENNKIRMRVFERGSGITLACGTGACASVSVAVDRGLIQKSEETEVILDGGSLYIVVDENNSVTMRGAAETVFEGEIDL